MPKYLLCPGPVVSQNDGQTHHVSASQLAALYGVHMEECRVLPYTAQQRGWKPTPGLIQLHPRYDGDYRLPGVDK